MIRTCIFLSFPMSDIKRPTSYISPSLRPFIEMLMGEHSLGMTLIDAQTRADAESAELIKPSKEPADLEPPVWDQERSA